MWPWGCGEHRQIAASGAVGPLARAGPLAAHVQLLRSLLNLSPPCLHIDELHVRGHRPHLLPNCNEIEVGRHAREHRGSEGAKCDGICQFTLHRSHLVWRVPIQLAARACLSAPPLHDGITRCGQLPRSRAQHLHLSRGLFEAGIEFGSR